MNQTIDQFFDIEKNEKQKRSIYLLGAICTMIALIGILADIAIGNITGGDLSLLPQTAIDRFIQFQENRFLGLYNLDLLNSINQILFIPGYFALFIYLSEKNKEYSLLALLIFVFGSALMVANNVALPMLELSEKYFASASEVQKGFYAAAGESMLASGAHGSPGIFFGFFIPNVAGLLMSIVMLKSGILGKWYSWFGIIGSCLLMVYVTTVNFVASSEQFATGLAMPGGLLAMVWMIMFTLKLFKAGRNLPKEE